jgi:hypothetical protein
VANKEARVPDKLNDADWSLLLGRIKEGKCTPFVGAGACYGTLPLGSVVAADWAGKEGFPFEDCHDLAKVAQFLSVKYDAIRPKDMFIDQYKNIGPPNFEDPFEPHRVLADLPLPIYITTNYDDFLFRALSRAEYAPGQHKNPRRELCKWNQQIGGVRPKARKRVPRLDGDVQNPIVFHLHGNMECRESMVLTEDDYLDFLIKIGKDDALLPPRIEEAFTSTSLLFVGYSLSDWNFRVLFRSVVSYLEISTRRVHISVQLAPLGKTASDDQKRNAEEYLNRYFSKLDIRVYWGNATEFAKELSQHWELAKNSEARNGD